MFDQKKRKKRQDMYGFDKIKKKEKARYVWVKTCLL